MAEEDSTAEGRSPTRVLLTVNKSDKGYPTPCISSEYAFHWVLEKLIPRRCGEDYKLLILHVMPEDEDGLDDLDSVFATARDFKELKQREEKKGLQLLEYFVKKSNEAHVPCEAWVTAGDPQHRICEEIRRVQPDLLVLGSRNLTKFQEMFVGSVSNYCYKHAGCPVLVARRPPQLAPDDPISD